MIDVMTIALGFVLRVIAGAYALGMLYPEVGPSVWLCLWNTLRLCRRRVGVNYQYGLSETCRDSTTPVAMRIPVRPSGSTVAEYMDRERRQGSEDLL